MLTDKFCKTAKAGWHGDGNGLYLRVTEGGARTWYLRKRVAGKLHSKAIGRYPELGVKRARQKAVTAKVDATSPTFEIIAEDWFSDFEKRSRRPENAVKLLDGVLLPAFGKVRIGNLDRQTVVGFFRQYRYKAPRRSYSAASIARQIFRHAIALGYIDTSPLEGVPLDMLGAGSGRRDALVSQDELKRLAQSNKPHAAALIVSCLTGLRIGEIIEPWRGQELDGDVLRIAETKNGKPFTTYLPPIARDKWQQPWPTYRAIYQWLTKDGWELRPHDCRRWCATTLQKIGCPPHIIDAQLNHTPQGMRATYQRFDYMDERREWLDKLSQHLEVLTASDAISSI